MPICWLVTTLLMLAGALNNAAAAPAPTRFDFRTTPGHLSKDVVPQHVRLELELDPALDTFRGRVDIKLRVHRPVAAIEIHAHELDAESVSLRGTAGVRALGVSPRTESQTWLLTPEDGAGVAPGVYRLDISYRGIVHRNGEGLYRAEYTRQGKPQRTLATQLQAIHARTLFPGFDEPVFRAVFELTVRAPPQHEVLSNMPRRGAPQRRADVLEHRFAPTPPMPSYLVAVAVGEFDALEGHAAGVPLRILTAPGKRDLGRYALDATRQVLPYYTRYFRQPYTLPRLDQLAVPSTRWGAMEDWGLISYAEDDLLYDPSQSSPQTQRDVFSIVAHEVAHQWFGNLVTAASWNELWLNEAFATWLAEKAADRFNPDWQIPLNRRKPIDRAMLRDGGSATRAIRSGPVSEARVADVFDDITYEKGGAVLSMLEQWIGPSAFQRGLAAYIAQRKLSNATAGDLWFHIGRASGRNVAAVAASWTDQQGFPLVRMRSRCEAGQTVLELTQQRFGFDVAAGSAASPQHWQIPLRVARGERFTTLLQTMPQQSFRLPACAAEPLVLNAGGAGFYRVAYEAGDRAALQRAFTRLAAADQVTLLSDTFALAQRGELPFATYFELIALLPRVQGAGRDMLATQAGDHLVLLDTALARTPAQAPLRAAARALLAPEFARLGWWPRPTDAAEALALRANLIERLARFDDAGVVEQAMQAFDADAAGQRALPGSIRSAVVRAVGMHADRSRFDALLARLQSAGGEEDRWLYAGALASGRDEARAAEFLQLALADGLPPNIATRCPAWWRGARHSARWRTASPSTTGRPWPHVPDVPGRSGCCPARRRASTRVTTRRGCARTRCASPAPKVRRLQPARRRESSCWRRSVCVKWLRLNRC
jgi:Peptidase family M1 domain/Peptidase M1 N-terminal domain/ERAP1-like C-terminal domain